MGNLSQIELLLPELRAYARSICGPTESAEDLVHDAIERALRHATRPERVEELRPWMFRVIRNLQYDELRKRRVRREYIAVQKRLLDESDGTGSGGRDILIRLAFEKLPPEIREVLFLIDIMGFKYAEAAEVMNVPIGTVMSRVSRARKELLRRVNGDGQNEKRTKQTP
ncbi:RNA polymerase sigma factor [Nitratireductor kimnyeongensis]|uniref:RNA polymerase sigma factor n=1 Tax=Nitratireductor kimnyeongensis TaxID=430679 RepID=A0ABW0TCS4_9HYPH|nr:RNA polymerase sigma factor [Nitratireductor kimnyeongensis]QZZ37693.1 RNA polymerase sigma factor [Nitratireductor kimnyeongensis]